MKKFLILFTFLISILATSLLYPQSSDSCGYYSFGLFGGSYVSYYNHMYAANDFISAVTLEMEYRKSGEWAFFASVMYQFTNNDLKRIYPDLSGDDITITKNPVTHLGIFSFGGRYYFNTKKINPYISFGLSNEFTYIGKYSYYVAQGPLNTQGHNEESLKGYWYTRFSILAGAGMNMHLSKKLLLEFQYNMYQSIEKSNGNTLGFTTWGGLRYVL